MTCKDVPDEVKIAYDENGIPYMLEAFGSEAEHINRLLSAEQDNRLIELPCKLGDTMYQTDGERIYEIKITNIIYDTAGIAFDERAIGKTVFLTREEAEKALK